MQILPQYHQNLRKLNGTDKGYNKVKENKKKKKKKSTLYNSLLRKKVMNNGS